MKNYKRIKEEKEKVGGGGELMTPTITIGTKIKTKIMEIIRKIYFEKTKKKGDVGEAIVDVGSDSPLFGLHYSLI